jgi:hypothetical protein
MKILIAVILFSGIAVTVVNSKFINAMGSINDNVSFYEVPLVCNAAPSIGCGSRAKPVLVSLEKLDVIKEAWLNRKGNVIAIVWSEDSSPEFRTKEVAELFNENNLETSELVDDEYSINFESFLSHKDWYRREDVNTLSKEEAGIIADQLMEVIISNTELGDENQELLKKEIHYVFYDFFLNFENLNQLADASIYKDKLRSIIKTGEKYVGKGNMPTVDELWKACTAANTSSCDHNSCKGSCEIEI